MIPSFQTIMLPLLEFSADGKKHSKKEAVKYISDKFSLSDKEKTRTYSVSGVKIIYSRVHFAETYLIKAELLKSVGRGYFKITKRGLGVLRKKLKKIDVKFLEQFPEFVEFRNKKQEKTKKADQETDHTETDLPPIELLERGYKRIREDLAEALLKQVKKCSPEFFEKLVVELLLKMGYGGSREDAGKAVGRTGDGGIDGIIKEDKLGLDVIYIQAKKWNRPVGSQYIREFIGSLVNNNANKGVFITTSTFTKSAKDSIRNGANRITLIDGELLAQFMIDYNIGVYSKINYEVKEIDTDYFSEQ